MNTLTWIWKEVDDGKRYFRPNFCRSSDCFNHFIHHRGQLSGYLRLNDIPVPGVYGPTADE